MGTVSLPGKVPSALNRAQLSATEEERTALAERLLGTVSADLLAQALTRAGFPVSATTIRNYRRSLRKDV